LIVIQQNQDLTLSSKLYPLIIRNASHQSQNISNEKGEFLPKYYFGKFKKGFGGIELKKLQFNQKTKTRELDPHFLRMLVGFLLRVIVLVQILRSGNGMSFFELGRYNKACVINKVCDGKIIGIKTEVKVTLSTSFFYLYFLNCFSQDLFQ